MSVNYNMMMEVVDPFETPVNVTYGRSFSSGIDKRLL
jgi:hypothetical protein